MYNIFYIVTNIFDILKFLSLSFMLLNEESPSNYYIWNMNTFLHILKRTIVIFISLFSGAMLNGAIINISSKVIAPPKGFDLNTAEGLQAAMPHMGPEHFLFPFLAHALGTLISALLITRFLKSQQFVFAMMAGILFMLGGISMVIMLPETPIWFILVDLIGAYIPMAYLGYKLVKKSS